MSQKTKVLLVDDHSVVIEGIKKAFENEPNFEIVGTANDGLKVIPLVKSLKPGVVIMDISMPNLDGIEATYEVKKFNKKIAIVIFTMYRDREYIVSLFKMGVSGYVFKDESLEDLVLAVRAVREGGTYYSKTAQKILRDHMEELEQGGSAKDMEMRNGIIRLSVREKEIFPLLADGLSIKEIADRLYISTKTVETHKYNIMEKLDAHSIADLTKLAIKKKLINV